MATLSQTFADSLKKKYKSLADVQATSARWSMTPDIQAQISWFYNTPSSVWTNTWGDINNINKDNNLLWSNTLVDTWNQGGTQWWTFGAAPINTVKIPAWVKSIDYKAPNDKPYTLIETSRGTYFKAQDWQNKMFPTTAEAQAYIDEQNPEWSASAVSAAQDNFNKKYSTTYVEPTWMAGSTAEVKQWKDESYEDFSWRKKVADLESSLTNTVKNMQMWNTEFKKLVDDNLATQLLKNKALQDALAAQKRETDAAFKWIETKFTDSQKNALARVDEMEKKWMENFNNIQEETKKYYKDQSSALDSSLGWEQAWLAGSMAAKGINEWVIANALAQAKEAHQWQYNALLKNNTEIMKQLNSDYLNFFKDVQAERNKWSTDEYNNILKPKFDQAKAIIDASKTLSDATINASFKPFEDAIAKASEAQATQAGFAATDKARIARYKESTPEQRKLMLMAQLWLDDSTLAYGTTSNFDIALLDKAVSAWELSEAIRILGKGYKAAIESGANINSPLMKAIDKKISEAEDNKNIPKVETDTDVTKPLDTTKEEEPEVINASDSLPNWADFYKQLQEVAKLKTEWTGIDNMAIKLLQGKIWRNNEIIKSSSDAFARAKAKSDNDKLNTELNSLVTKWKENQLNRNRVTLAQWILESLKKYNNAVNKYNILVEWWESKSKEAIALKAEFEKIKKNTLEPLANRYKTQFSNLNK